MTDTVPAAATGSPSFDRRSFLSTLIAAGVLSAGTVLPATAADEHPDAELLELGAVLVAAEARRDAFDREVDEALDRCERPKIPEALYWRRSDFMTVCVDRNRRLAQYGEGDDTRWVYEDKPEITSLREHLAVLKAADIANDGWGTSAQSIARHEEILAAHEVWNAEIAAAEARAGYTKAAEGSAREDASINSLQRRIISIAAHTMAGLAVKSRAAATCWGYDPIALLVRTPTGLADLPADMGDADPSVWAMSIIIDAMKLGATSAPVSFSARDAA